VGESAYFRVQSARCRRLARQCSDREVATTLERLAEEYDRKACEIEPNETPQDAPPPPKRER